MHVGLGALAALVAGVLGDTATQCVASGLAVVALCLLVFPLLTQLMFKPAERELTIDADGWETTIGSMNAARRWAEVRRIADVGDAIEMVGVNGNVMIVPRRAFADERARTEFLAAAAAWHAAAPG